MKKIVKFLKKLFTEEKQYGIIIQKFLAEVRTDIIGEILDIENQKRAFEFVKSLNERKDCTAKEKQEFFNLKMLVYAQEKGKKLSTSVINCLRELAVIALKEDDK